MALSSHDHARTDTKRTVHVAPPQLAPQDFEAFSMDGATVSKSPPDNQNMSHSSPNLLSRIKDVASTPFPHINKSRRVASPERSNNERDANHSTPSPIPPPPRRGSLNAAHNPELKSDDAKRSTAATPPPITTLRSSPFERHNAASATAHQTPSPIYNPLRRLASLNHNSSPVTDDTSTTSTQQTHAAGGKTSRVIDRLMADIDKLRHTLAAETTLRQQLDREAATHAATLEALRAENENLTQTHDVDAAVLGRRDRLIEGLRAELDAERKSRSAADDRARAAEEEREQGRDRVTEAEAKAERAQADRDALCDTVGRYASMAREVERMRTERDEERRKVRAHIKAVEELQAEMERNRRVRVEMEELVEEMGRVGVGTGVGGMAVLRT